MQSQRQCLLDFSLDARSGLSSDLFRPREPPVMIASFPSNGLAVPDFRFVEELTRRYPGREAMMKMVREM